MNTQTSHVYPITLADRFIAQRFAQIYGITTHEGYLDHLDKTSTVHLSGKQAKRLHRTSGQQRRNARLRFIEGQLIIIITANNPQTGKPVHIEVEYDQWVGLMKLGATYAWNYNIKGKHRGIGQVVTQVAFQGGRHETVARLIKDARKGQQARMRDGNPFNLRLSNIDVTGDLTTAEGRVGTAKSDARLRMWDGRKARALHAGKRYGNQNKGDK